MERMLIEVGAESVDNVRKERGCAFNYFCNLDLLIQTVGKELSCIVKRYTLNSIFFPERKKRS